ncbi:MAG: hypothetical protein IKU01_08185 [Bacteroidales bacterium]|nr:hypothetical protein [Bacteroidales bacterium]
MNPQLEKYINNRKEEIKKQRENHLLSLGLIDESKTIVERILVDDIVVKFDKTLNKYYFEDEVKNVRVVKFDETLNKYYFEEETKFPIDITEEEYQELLKYIPQDKIKPNKEASENLTTLNKSYKVFAYILLILGIILTITTTPFKIGIFCIILSITIFIERIFIKGFIVIVENTENNRCN